MDIGNFLTLLGVVITAFATLRVAHISFRSKNVNEQRILWREHVRKLTSVIAGNATYTKKEEAITKLKIRLNPSDEFDKKIIQSGFKLILNKNKENIDEFVTLVSLLLKYDWERCKLESCFFSWCYKVVIIKENTHEAKLASLSLEDYQTVSEIKIKSVKCKWAIIIIIFLIISVFLIYPFIYFTSINYYYQFNVLYDSTLMAC